MQTVVGRDFNVFVKNIQFMLFRCCRCWGWKWQKIFAPLLFGNIVSPRLRKYWQWAEESSALKKCTIGRTGSESPDVMITAADSAGRETAREAGRGLKRDAREMKERSGERQRSLECLNYEQEMWLHWGEKEASERKIWRVLGLVASLESIGRLAANYCQQ